MLKLFSSFPFKPSHKKNLTLSLSKLRLKDCASTDGYIKNKETVDLLHKPQLVAKLICDFVFQKPKSGFPASWLFLQTNFNVFGNNKVKVRSNHLLKEQLPW